MLIHQWKKIHLFLIQLMEWNHEEMDTGFGWPDGNYTYKANTNSIRTSFVWLTTAVMVKLKSILIFISTLYKSTWMRSIKNAILWLVTLFTFYSVIDSE